MKNIKMSPDCFLLCYIMLIAKVLSEKFVSSIWHRTTKQFYNLTFELSALSA